LELKLTRWQNGQIRSIGGIEDDRLSQIEVVKRPQIKVYKYGRITKRDFENLVRPYN
jgi:hypothetical protein